MPKGQGGGGELERVLRETFPALSLGEVNYDTSKKSEQGVTPGVVYSGGPQTQEGGPKGRRGRRRLDQTSALFRDIDRSKCPPWLSEDCMELLSRGMEQTLRNFQLTARRPSHIDPPFRAKYIDKFTPAPGVTIPIGSHGSPGVWTPVATFTGVPDGFRGEVTGLGQGVLNVSAWNDLEWRIVRNGTPLDGLDAFRLQLFDLLPLTSIVPMHIVGKDSVVIEARNYAASTYQALARIGGWFYPVRVETGDSIRSTIVD